MSKKSDIGDDNAAQTGACGSNSADCDNCVICLEEKRSPVFIRCGHSFCAICITQFETHSIINASKLRCPICRSCLEETRPNMHGTFFGEVLIVENSSGNRSASLHRCVQQTFGNAINGSDDNENILLQVTTEEVDEMDIENPIDNLLLEIIAEEEHEMDNEISLENIIFEETDNEFVEIILEVSGEEETDSEFEDGLEDIIVEEQWETGFVDESDIWVDEYEDSMNL